MCFFSVYQAKRLLYPIVYQSYRMVRESCSIVRVLYRIVRKPILSFIFLKNNVASTVFCEIFEWIRYKLLIQADVLICVHSDHHCNLISVTLFTAFCNIYSDRFKH